MKEHRSNRLSVARSALVLLALLAGCNSSSTSPAKRDESLRGQVRNLVVKYGIPGAVGIVATHGSITEISVSGIRCEGADNLVSATDLLHAGSIGKSMIAKHSLRPMPSRRLRRLSLCIRMSRIRSTPRRASRTICRSPDASTWTCSTSPARRSRSCSTARRMPGCIRFNGTDAISGVARYPRESIFAG